MSVCVHSYMYVCMYGVDSCYVYEYVCTMWNRVFSSYRVSLSLVTSDGLATDEYCHSRVSHM